MRGLPSHVNVADERHSTNPSKSSSGPLQRFWKRDICSTQFGCAHASESSLAQTPSIVLAETWLVVVLSCPFDEDEQAATARPKTEAVMKRKSTVGAPFE